MNRKTRQLTMLAGATTALAMAIKVVARRRARINFEGKTVVITGSSRGLGLVLARHLANEGARLALLARDSAELARARHDLQADDAHVLLVSCDVGDQQQVEKAFRQIASRFGSIDILINNAGVIQVGPQEHMRVDDFEQAMAVHFWGALYPALAAVDYMRRQGHGRIVNITSIGGRVAVPHLLPYTASKFAMVGFSDGLRAELAKDGILVTTITPGLMRTGSHVNALFKGRHRQEYTWFSISAALPFLSTHVDYAARQIINACRYGDSQHVITFPARLLILFNSLFPGFTASLTKMANRLLPDPEPLWGELVRTGWESHSRWSPSLLTVLADRAAYENNQLPGSDLTNIGS